MRQAHTLSRRGFIGSFSTARPTYQYLDDLRAR
jgi:hypothetical protein